MTKISSCLCAIVFGLTGSCSRQDSSLAARETKYQPPGPSPQWVTPPSPPSRPMPDAAVAQHDDVVVTAKGPLEIMPIRHASILFRFAQKNIYVDPAAEGNYDGLPKADFIFVTHGHADHFDKPRIEALRVPATVLVGPPEVGSKVSGVQVMKDTDKFTFPDFEVTAVRSYNLSRGPKPGELYHPKGQGEGYLFNFGGKRVFVSGDTECTPEVKALGEIDVAFVCMRLPYTMPPKEAAECVKAFKPRIVYPYHYQGSNLDEFKQAFAGDKSIEVRLRDWYPGK